MCGTKRKAARLPSSVSRMGTTIEHNKRKKLKLAEPLCSLDEVDDVL